MKEWFTIAELAAAGLPELPRTVRGLQMVTKRERWENAAQFCRRLNKSGGGFEYHISLLPPLARARLMVMHGADGFKSSDEEKKRARETWEKFEGLTEEQQGVCEIRLAAILYVKELRFGGLSVGAAVERAAMKFDFCVASIFNWLRLIEGFERCDWLAALAPSFATVGHNKAVCHTQAWTVLCADYLRASGPAFSSCYRRMRAAAGR